MTAGTFGSLVPPSSIFISVNFLSIFRRIDFCTCLYQAILLTSFALVVPGVSFSIFFTSLPSALAVFDCGLRALGAISLSLGVRAAGHAKI